MSTFGSIIRIGNRVTEVVPSGRGNLFFLEMSSMPTVFVPKRLFIVDSVPNGMTRGNHAHRTGQQFLVCIKGIVEISIDNGKEKKTVKLLPGDALFHDKMEWGAQKYFDNAVMLSICSTEYNPDDYITDYNEFIKMVNNEV